MKKKIAILFFLFQLFLFSYAISGSHILYQAQQAFEREQYEKSIDLIDQYLKISPENGEALFLKSKAEFWINDITNAIKDAEKSIKIEPTSKKYGFLAYLYAKTNNLANIDKILFNLKNGLGYFYDIVQDYEIKNKIKADVYYDIIDLELDNAKNIYTVRIRDLIPLCAQHLQFLSSIESSDEIYNYAQNIEEEVNDKYIKGLNAIIEHSYKDKNLIALYEDVVAGIFMQARGKEEGKNVVDGAMNLYINKIGIEIEKRLIEILIDHSRKALNDSSQKYSVGITIGSGAVVKSVAEGSSADLAGLKPGDIIGKIDYRNHVCEDNNCQNLMRYFIGNPNDNVTVTILRPNELSKLNIVAANQKTYTLDFDTKIKEKEKYINGVGKVTQYEFEPKLIKFYGIGAKIELGKNDYPAITAVVPSSPAKKAGIDTKKNGYYQIVKVNGKDMQGLSIEETIKMIRGKENTYVDLEVIKAGSKKIKKYHIKREAIYTKR